MSKLFSILLIAFYALTLSQAYVPQVNYWMNKDFITAELCENNDKPELKCEGKCHLVKEIQGAADNEADGQEVPVMLMVEFYQPYEKLEFESVSVELKNYGLINSPAIISGYVSGIFHPPQNTCA